MAKVHDLPLWATKRPWSRLDQEARTMPASLLQLSREGAVTNDRRPCVTPRCGFVYPWRGTPEQLRDVRRLTGGRCPACVNGALPGRGVGALDLKKTTKAAIAFGRLIGVRS